MAYILQEPSEVQYGISSSRSVKFKRMVPDQDFIVFGGPQITESDIDAVASVVKSRWLGTGPKVKEFQQKFAEYKSVSDAAAVSSCTAALHLSLLSLKLGAGDEVITTPLTFCATVNAIIHAGATPVLADIDPTSMNIDPAQIECKINSKTRAIIPVHFAGRPCQMDKIMDLANKHGLYVIEDCAHAIEAEFHGKKTGTFGDLGCFSFYATKNLATGEGGMVLSKNPERLARVRTLSLHGMDRDAWKRFGDEGYKHYLVTECGYKYNMMDIQAALGLEQLKRLEANHRGREDIWNFYNDEFKNLPIQTPAPVESGTRHAYHLYCILVDERRCGIQRDQFLEKMTAEKIGVGVHYLSIAEHPYYKERFGWRPDDFPIAKEIGRTTVSLPLTAALTDGHISRIVAAVGRILSS